MLYPALRTLLFQLDAECAHQIGLAAARSLARHPRGARLVHDWLARPSCRPVQAAGLSFAHPIGLAAGLDKNAEAPLAWWAMGFAFIELGTVTPLAQSGKPKPRLFRLPHQRALVNRMGFNNDGAACVASRLREQTLSGLRPPCPIGLSIGKNATTPPEQVAEDYAKAAAMLAPHSDYLAINVSSPNTPGLRDLQSARELSCLLDAVRSSAGERPLFVKIAPELEATPLREVLDVCLSSGVAGVIATNTLATVGRDDLPEGGLSGRPLRRRALEKVSDVRKHVAGRMVVIGCGGIDDPSSARAMLNAGADLVQLYTGLVYQGPFLPARLSRALNAVVDSR